MKRERALSFSRFSGTRIARACLMDRSPDSLKLFMCAMPLLLLLPRGFWYMHQSPRTTDFNVNQRKEDGDRGGVCRVSRGIYYGNQY